MARTVKCVKLDKELDGLDFPPYPGPLGKRIFESVFHGWEYLPQYFLSSFAYIGIFWLISHFVNINKFLSFYKKFKSS